MIIPPKFRYIEKVYDFMVKLERQIFILRNFKNGKIHRPQK